MTHNPRHMTVSDGRETQASSAKWTKAQRTDTALQDWAQKLKYVT